MNPTKIIAHLAIIAVAMAALAEAGNINQHAPQTNVSSDDAFVTPIPADNTPIATPVPTTPAPSVTDAPEATPAPTTPAPSVTYAPEATPVPTVATPKPTPCATPTPKPTPCATPAPTTADASATPSPTKPSDEANEKSENGNKSPATNPKNGPSSDHEDRTATATAVAHNDGQRVSSSANTGSVVSGASATAGNPARAGVLDSVSTPDWARVLVSARTLVWSLEPASEQTPDCTPELAWVPMPASLPGLVLARTLDCAQVLASVLTPDWARVLVSARTLVWSLEPASERTPDWVPELAWVPMPASLPGLVLARTLDCAQVLVSVLTPDWARVLVWSLEPASEQTPDCTPELAWVPMPA
ncbi:hypothetical protein PR003_g28768 [Phytophthora rubi]|uniref:RxLR effector protein n=1 Tax=Phytophthora rubi TaxID=129364 RepID=A0A6A4BRB5_9STRA|nr:hypothetical protein PR003_g28768 [Phytophthora rubi]